MNPESRKRTLRRYGLTQAQYLEKLMKQGYVCAICGQRERSPRHKHLSIDHNHETGRTRGLLCSTCNFALGHFKDNVQYLHNAIHYLNHYSGD